MVMLEDNPLHFVFQPMIDKAGNIIALECLSRMSGELSKQYKSIDVFFNSISYTNKVKIIESQVKYIIKYSSWFVRNSIIATINIDDSDLLDFCSEEVKELLSLHSFLQFEITESSSSLLSQNKIKEHSSNVSFWLDDFGTEYSNFSALNKLKFNYIKFDKSMLSYFMKSNDGHNLIKSLISHFKINNYKIIIEGVENGIQYSWLKGMDWDGLQGHMWPHRNIESFIDNPMIIYQK